MAFSHGCAAENRRCLRGSTVYVSDGVEAAKKGDRVRLARNAVQPRPVGNVANEPIMFATLSRIVPDGAGPARTGNVRRHLRDRTLEPFSAIREVDTENIGEPFAGFQADKILSHLGPAKGLWASEIRAVREMASHKASKFTAALALFALSAGAAHALDGEVLIDQATAKAGGVTPRDRPGFPVTISRTGKYKLTGNLNVPARRNGIEVKAPNVTIDLNGFTISGGKVAVDAPDDDGLTVMNGTIDGAASQGIVARSFAVVQDMQITNTGGVGVTLESAGRVLRSTISDTAGTDIQCRGQCLIANNIIARSTNGSGIELLTEAGGHLVLGNVITDNQSFGIYAAGVTGFGNNTLTGNNGGGAQIIGNGEISPVHPNFCDPACP
jgi:hypothetical protein